MPKVITTASQARLTVKRSKFHAMAFGAASMDEVQSQVETFATKHRRSRHVCWACRVGASDEGLVEQMRDDGEVGRPGLVMLDMLRRRDLLGGIVVARYFGGVKLGVGGVSRAFREVAEAALEGAV
ncbi:MAG: YigZ family protein [Acidobacteria bacterium]|nr:YigZ family protein [Acidobacteriota bacterium]